MSINFCLFLLSQNMDVNGSGGCFLPDDSYPNWLTFSSEVSSVTFDVPQVEGHNLITLHQMALKMLLYIGFKLRIQETLKSCHDFEHRNTIGLAGSMIF